VEKTFTTIQPVVRENSGAQFNIVVRGVGFEPTYPFGTEVSLTTLVRLISIGVIWRKGYMDISTFY